MRLEVLRTWNSGSFARFARLVLAAAKYGGSKKLVSLIMSAVIGTAACGGGEPPSAPPSFDVDAHLRLVIEPIPFDALKSGTLVFYRESRVAPFGYGLVIVDLNQRRVTTAPQSPLSWDLAVSPDAKRIAFTSGLGVTGNTRARDVFVKDIGSQDGTALGGPGGSHFFPSWSPDGRGLLYGETPNYTIGQERIVRQSPVPGATDRTFLSDALPIGCDLMSPASSRQDGTIVFTASACTSAPATLYLRRPGALVTLVQTTGGLPTKSLMSPVWSPDGTEVAFLEKAPGSPGTLGTLAVKLISGDGSGLRTIVSAPDAESSSIPRPEFRTLCWMGGGTTLVFTNAEADFSEHIYVVNRDGSGLVKITSDPGSTDRWASCAP